jgi:tetratricopeptide (TPR) repeat protein
VFGVQDEIAAAVAESLQVRLTGGAPASLGQTKNAVAFQRYLQGKYFFNRRGEADVVRAREYFEQALQLDPGYARAWAGLAGVYQIGRQQGWPDAQSEWRAAIDKALALGPNLADAHVRAAQFYWRLGDGQASEAHCHRAIVLNPSDPLVLGASAGRAFSKGHWSEGLALQRRAVAVDPLSAIGRGNLGVYLTMLGEWDEAIVEFEKARELSPTLNKIDSDIARVQILRERFDEAFAAAERIPAGPGRDQCIALAHRAPGQRTAADAALARLVARANGPDRDRAVEVSIAEAYAFRGQEEEAMKWLTRAMEQQDGRNWTRDEVMESPFLRALHADARWRVLLARADTR